MKKVFIFCVNTKKNYSVKIGTNLNELRNIVYNEDCTDIMGALVNNELEDMQYVVLRPLKVEFVMVSSLDGYSIYTRSLIFLLHKAVRSLFRRKNIIVEYFISNGIFIKISKRALFLDDDNIALIKNRMIQLVSENIPITRKDVPTEYAIKVFKKKGLNKKINLMRTRGKLYTSIYYINDEPDYLYGTLAPSTACLKIFDLIRYKDGMLLVLPNREDASKLLPIINQDKLFSIYSEHKRWGKSIGISDIGDLNNMIASKRAGMMIKVGEAIQEKKISIIADKIRTKHRKIKLVLISGPSSSGKTTFSKRLSVQLEVNGIRPLNLSLDNYFVNREDTPLDKNGEYDYETIEALDIEKFNRDIADLMLGKEIEIPKFSFETGLRYYNGEKMKMGKNNVLVVEGIHGLNPKLTPLLPSECMFKIFVSVLTAISIDDHNLINPTDNRLIRRMIRDFKYRNYSAVDTLSRWESVLKGEKEHIVPYQEEADVLFNSAMIYELGALKAQAEPLLKDVKEIYPEHSKALKLLKFFSYVKSIPTNEIPSNSLIREFLGGSSFEY